MMGYSFGLAGRSGKVLTSAYDPAVLSLTGWWRDYAASPWVGTASAGASGGRTLTEATNPPAAGAAVNGHAPADFDGSNDKLASALTLGDFISSSHWSMWALAWVDNAFASGGAGTLYTNPAFFVDTPNAYLTAGFSSDGMALYHNAAEYAVAQATGAWALLQWKYDGTDIKLRVNAGAWVGTNSTNIPDVTGTMLMGVRYDGGTTFLDGKILDFGVADSLINDATFDDILSYARAQYALALL